MEIKRVERKVTVITLAVRAYSFIYYRLFSR